MYHVIIVEYFEGISKLYLRKRHMVAPAKSSTATDRLIMIWMGLMV